MKTCIHCGMDVTYEADDSLINQFAYLYHTDTGSLWCEDGRRAKVLED